MYHDKHNYCNFGMQFEPNYDAISFHAPNLLFLKNGCGSKNPEMTEIWATSKLTET